MAMPQDPSSRRRSTSALTPASLIALPSGWVPVRVQRLATSAVPPARVTRYWRWRTFYGSLPLLVLLVSGAIVLPWGPWWVRWGIVGCVSVMAANLAHTGAAGHWESP